MKQICWVIMLAVTLSMGTAKADIVTIEMTGTVTSVFDYYERFEGTDVKTGAEWTATITYDTKAAPTSISPDNGSYGAHASYDILSYTTRIGSYIFETGNPTAHLTDNYWHNTYDLLQFMDRPDDYSHGNGIEQYIFFQDNSGTLLADDNLPEDLSLERLSDFDFSSAYFFMRYDTKEYISAYSGYAVDIYGDLSTVTVTVSPNSVPIPGGIWLLGSGLLGLVRFRRK